MSQHSLNNIENKGFFYNVKRYKFLIKQLIKVDVLSGYKKSYIGILWMVIYPIISVITWVVLNSAGIIEPGELEIPYPAYVLLSTSIWGFFIGIYQTTSQIILNGGRMMVMNKFPHEVLIVNKLIVHLILFAIPFVVNICVLLFYGVSLKSVSLLFPFSLVPILCAGMAIGLIVAILRVVALDLVNIIDEFMKLLMFLTPVVYTAKFGNSFLADFVEWNPLTYLIGFSRDLLISGKIDFSMGFILSAIGSFIAFFLALWFFKLVASTVLERLVIN